MKRFLILILVIWSSHTWAQSGTLVTDSYDLIVETEIVALNCFDGDFGEALVHRFYIEAENSTDKLSAVFGNDQSPLRVTAPSGVYNSDANSGNAFPSTVDPLIVGGFFPCLSYDSYITIGIEEGPVDYDGGEAPPSYVYDPQGSPSLLSFFSVNTLGEFAELNVNTLTGASWYVLNAATNSLPDEDGRWYIMQLTSASHVEGVLNFQIFPLGEESNQIQITQPFNTAPPCSDPYACNYEPSAFEDQDFCDYSCCPGPGCCGEGTTWDSESQTCLTTFLHDADFDGCVGLSDLLSLLSVFGSCLEE